MLGPLEARVDGRSVQVSGLQGAFLALLAADPGATVTLDRLADALWPGEAPRNPANAIQILVSRLRARLGADLVETRPGGYRLAVPLDDLDAATFERLVETAAAVEPDRAKDLLSAAERLWRGPAFTPYDDLPGVRSAAARLTELRSTARERRGQALLELGRFSDAVPDLDALRPGRSAAGDRRRGAGDRAGTHGPRRGGPRAGG